jgi:transposase IS204/IS1001/IS1096/IS1165 family protein
VFEPTASQPDAASAIFILPDYRVIDVGEDLNGVRRVEFESTDPAGCPALGVLAGRVHSRRRQRLRDLPVAGLTAVVWVQRRWSCGGHPMGACDLAGRPARHCDGREVVCQVQSITVVVCAGDHPASVEVTAP